ncbi:MAG: hypothetical protein KJ630_10630 [Proteobacteria bacterium]|nr:hypothetical protein [Pseudomonadota bacterium]
MNEIVSWSCNEMQAKVIGIDAHCRWSADGRTKVDQTTPSFQDQPGKIIVTKYRLDFFRGLLWVFSVGESMGERKFRYKKRG